MDGDHEYTHETRGFEVGAHVQVSTSPPNELNEVRKQNDEVVVVAQLRDKLADLVQLLGTGILPREQQRQPDSRPAPYVGKAAKPTATTTQKSDEHESIDPGEPVPCQEDDSISLTAPRNDYEIDDDCEEQSFTPPSSSMAGSTSGSAVDRPNQYKARARADLESLLGQAKPTSSSGKKRTASPEKSNSNSKKVKSGAIETADSDKEDLQVEEEILLEIDQSRPCDKKLGPPLLANLATRVNRYWKQESESESTVKFIKGQYLTPENCSDLVTPRLNREVYGRLHPFHRRQDKKYMDMQETLLSAVTAVANIASLALEADRTCHMVDTKMLVTHALNATTLMGNVQNKLNQKRKDLIAPTLPKEIRDVCSSQREVTSLLFGDDLGKAVREAKELSKLTSELSTGSRYPRKLQGKPAGYRPPRGSTIGSGQPGYQKPVFQQRRRPPYREKKDPRH